MVCIMEYQKETLPCDSRPIFNYYNSKVKSDSFPDEDLLGHVYCKEIDYIIIYVDLILKTSFEY